MAREHRVGLADGIRRIGFRKWYERELLSSHGWLLMTLLCTIGILAGFEGLAEHRASGSGRLNNVAAIGVFALIGIVALRRYLFRLMNAESAANQAVCSACETYGRLEVVAEEPSGEHLRVRCRHCRHEWTMDT